MKGQSQNKKRAAGKAKGNSADIKNTQKGGDNGESGKISAMTVVKHAVNIVFGILCAAAAFMFAAYGLYYKSLPFIANNFSLLFGLTAGIISSLLVAYVLFYAFGKQAFYRLILCALICLDIFAAIFFALSAAGILDELTDISALRDYIAGFGGTAVLIFILFQFLQVVVLPVPGSVSVAVGVALFGPLRCSLFSFVGIILGSFVAFFIGRVIGYKAVCWIVGKDDLDKWLKKLKGKDYLLLSIMFLLPLFPDDILCFVAGLSSMTWGYFTVMIIITRAISVLTTSYSLDLIPFNTWWGLLIWGILLAAIIIVFWLICKYSDKIDKFIKQKFTFFGKEK